MTPAEARDRLAEPFPADEVRWKPQSVKGNRALAICYIDARCVMDRLDDVAGVDGWQDEYVQFPDHAVLCRLSVRFGSDWVTKSDVGGESEQPDGGDRCKAAHSDALKRAAVKFGVGRYLYSLPHQWCDYDPAKRQFVNAPRLPDWALPRPKQAQAAPPPARTATDPLAAQKAKMADAIAEAEKNQPAQTSPEQKHAETLRSIRRAAEDKGVSTGAQWAAVWRACNIRKGASLVDLTPAQAFAALTHIQSLPDAA